MACKAELGKYPMIIDISKKILNYFSYLHEKDDISIVKQYELHFTTVVKIVLTQI